MNSIMDINLYKKVCHLEDFLEGLGIDMPDDYTRIERFEGDWREAKSLVKITLEIDRDAVANSINWASFQQRLKRSMEI